MLSVAHSKRDTEIVVFLSRRRSSGKGGGNKIVTNLRICGWVSPHRDYSDLHVVILVGVTSKTPEPPSVSPHDNPFALFPSCAMAHNSSVPLSVVSRWRSQARQGR